ncbi:MAG TPA: LCP family protein [Solirubrobacterales bacterium]|nr:LCP family protein [Solirubrobacterales bacterium]
MPTNDEQQAAGPPEYKVFRSRKGPLGRLRKPEPAGLRNLGGRPPKPPRRGLRRRRGGLPGPPRSRARRILKWLGIAALGWILLSFLAFAVSAQLQSFKLSGEAKSALHGNPFLLPTAQTILVLGTDARPTNTKEPSPAGGSAAPSKECFEQQAHGDAPHGECSQGQFRADTLMLIRAGGGTFRKLSIPRDTYAQIPGQSPQKINAAFAFGGARAEIEAVEQFLGIKIDHVAIVDFTGFEKLIDAVGGVEVNVPHRLCADISGGAGHGQGGITLRLHAGENTLDGQKALAYARVREPSECPGPGRSAYSLGYSDFDRAKAQQAVIAGIKARLTDPLRLPYNFVMGPIIGWDAPKAFVSDMGFLTMPQLVLAAAIGGESTSNVLCAGANTECTLGGPGGSIEVPESERRRAVHHLLNG